MLTCHAKHETNSRTLNVTNECSVAKTGVWKCTLVLYMEIAVKCAWQGSRWGQQIIEDIYPQQCLTKRSKVLNTTYLKELPELVMRPIIIFCE